MNYLSTAINAKRKKKNLEKGQQKHHNVTFFKKNTILVGEREVFESKEMVEFDC